jgi:hypothetical protein
VRWDHCLIAERRNSDNPLYARSLPLPSACQWLTRSSTISISWILSALLTKESSIVNKWAINENTAAVFV